MDMTTKENAIRWLGTGISLLGLFVMCLVVIKPANHVLFHCDRNEDACTLEQSSIFHYEKKSIKIENIRHARLGMVRLLMYDIEIVKLDGNAISFGISTSWPFTTRYERNVAEINDFLNTEKSQFLSVEQRGYFSTILMALFLLGGFFCLYKALKPYVVEGFTK